MIGIMQPYFFPYIGYFQLIDAVDIYVNLDHVSFIKRGYMTKNSINGQVIRIPIKSASQNKKCNETFVDFDEKYVKKFKKTLFFLYKNTKNYELIKNMILPIFDKKEQTISEFNLKLIKVVCNYLDIKTKIVNTSEGLTESKREFGIRDITNHFNSAIYVNAIGGQSLYSKDEFKKNNVELKFIEMGDVNFDNKYTSILDLMFIYDKDYIKKELKKYKLI